MYQVLQGDCLETLRTLPDESVHCCVTSPPYFALRDYGVDGQIGLESTPDEYVAKMVLVFREVRRVLRADGTLWLNLGDSYAANRSYQVTDNKHIDVGNNGAMRVPFGFKPKDLIGIPWRVAFALQADGWWLRQDIIWSKPNPMPESVQDRCTKAHEYIFLLSKSERYYYDNEAIREQRTSDEDSNTFRGGCYVNGNTDNSTMGKRKTRGNKRLPPLQGSHGTMGHDGNGMRMTEKWNNPNGRNKRSVWTVATQPYPEAHFATFPPRLIEPCVFAGCPTGGTVLDPFAGSGTTLQVAVENNRSAIGCELNPDYIELIHRRLLKVTPNALFA